MVLRTLVRNSFDFIFLGSTLMYLTFPTKTLMVSQMNDTNNVNILLEVEKVVEADKLIVNNLFKIYQSIDELFIIENIQSNTHTHTHALTHTHTYTHIHTHTHTHTYTHTHTHAHRATRGPMRTYMQTLM